MLRMFVVHVEDEPEQAFETLKPALDYAHVRQGRVAGRLVYIADTVAEELVLGWWLLDREDNGR